MNMIKDILQDLILRLLNGVYGGVIFDTAGLAGLLFPCLLFIAPAVIVYLLLKLFPGIRRFAHVVITAMLIALIAFSSFFPGTLLTVGDHTVNWLQERTGITLEQKPAEPEAGADLL